MLGNNERGVSYLVEQSCWPILLVLLSFMLEGRGGRRGWRLEDDMGLELELKSACTKAQLGSPKPPHSN